MTTKFSNLNVVPDVNTSTELLSVKDGLETAQNEEKISRGSGFAAAEE